jgi:hypothetical protein
MKFVLAWLEFIHCPLNEPFSTDVLLFDTPTDPDKPMKTANTLVKDLTQLSELDAAIRCLEPKNTRCKKLILEAKEIRERLPTAILHHYDILVFKGKRGAARVRNNTCGGCHLSLPSGQLSDLLHDDVAPQVCGYCGIFILPQDPKPQECPPSAAEEPAAKPPPRKRKVKAAV